MKDLFQGTGKRMGRAIAAYLSFPFSIITYCEAWEAGSSVAKYFGDQKT
jgi:hypothetical protein